MKCLLLLFYATMNHFSIRLWCVTGEFIWQPARTRLVMTSSVVRLKRGSKALPKAKLAPRKGHGSCGLLPIWSTAAFWILVKPLYLRSMLSELMRCTENSKASSSTAQQKGPFCCLLHNAWLHIAQPTLQKLNEFGYKVLPHLPYSPDLSSTDLHIFKQLDNFLQGKCFHKQQDAENAFQEFGILKHATEINKHFFLEKMCWL